MNRKDKTLLLKVLSEIDVIDFLVKDSNEVEFLTDEKTQRAVAMTLINIGELVKNLSMELRLSYPQVPWRSISGLRDIVAHKYQTIRMEDIWITVNADLKSLKVILGNIVKDETI